MWEQQLRDLAARSGSDTIPCAEPQKQQLANPARRIGGQLGLGTQTDTAAPGRVKVAYTRPASDLP